MIKRVKQWFSDQKKVIQKTAGIKEKKEGTRLKKQAALAILSERREEDVPVVLERRHFA